MGNCLRHDSSMVWAGDDWGSVESKSHHNNSMQNYTKDSHGSTEKLKLLGETSSAGSSSSHEVKIKVSKKELEQLLERLRGGQGLPVEQVLLSQLMDGGDYHDLQRQLDHQRSWRPVLQSIPEVN